MKSMTGFSKASITEHGITTTVEIRSVNGRYLELGCKMPRNLSHKELDVRDMVKEVLERGSVNVSVKVEAALSGESALNSAKAQAYYTALETLRKKLKISDPVRISDLLAIPDVMETSSDDEKEAEAQWKVVAKAVKSALGSLDAARKNEGKEIAKDLRNRMKIIEDTLDTIEEIGMKRIPEERERMRTRIAQLFDADEIDEQRLQMEIVILADKLDISEECVRLRSHIKFMNDALKATEANGRQMNFMLQEMNREINTIGSKANDANVARMVVAVKDELERIREQVQNIE
ncbi:MAG: YicC family protein [Candidatus Kapabacteria bacterium]|nr:YicC family protein [Candidatus Kapabacteria bacterium]